MKTRPLLVFLILVAPLCVDAGAIYKHVDSAGNVSYSDRPPGEGEGEPVALPARPSEAQREEAANRLDRQRAEADRMKAAREQVGEQRPAEPPPPEVQAAPEQTEPEPEGYYPTYGRLNPDRGRLPGRNPDHPIYRPPSVLPSR